MQEKNEGQVRLFDFRQRYRRQVDEDEEKQVEIVSVFEASTRGTRIYTRKNVCQQTG